MSQTNYNVMRKKALQQKFDATDRIHLTCELKRGNLVLTFSTAAFESFRTILRNWWEMIINKYVDIGPIYIYS
jgi:hypothetical protein